MGERGRERAVEQTAELRLEINLSVPRGTELRTLDAAPRKVPRNGTRDRIKHAWFGNRLPKLPHDPACEPFSGDN